MFTSVSYRQAVKSAASTGQRCVNILFDIMSVLEMLIVLSDNTHFTDFNLTEQIQRNTNTGDTSTKQEEVTHPKTESQMNSSAAMYGDAVRGVRQAGMCWAETRSHLN